MKRLPQVLVILLLTAIVALLGTRNKMSDKFRIVTLAGGESYVAFSNPCIQVTSNANGYSALPLFDGDLISIKIDSTEFVYRYSKKDGTSLKFRMEGFKLFLNNRLFSLKVTGDPAFLDWFESMTPKEASGLKQIEIADSISPHGIGGLKKLAHLKPDLGIVISKADSKFMNFEEILEIFKPVWLAYEGKISEPGLEKLYSSGNLELLDIEYQNLDPRRLQRLTKLKTLIISQFESPAAGIDLGLSKNLRCLTLMFSGKLENLAFVSGATGLKEFNLVFCDSVRDISALAGLPNLTSIGFTATNIRCDLASIGKIPLISRFSFPANVDEKDFAEFIGSHKKLKIIELIGCEFIRDLEPLRTLPKLSCLSIFSDSLSTEKLPGFKNLDYLSVKASLPGDSTHLAELKKKLPNTTIVPSKGLCLGTGWILLVIPMLLLFCLSWFLYSKRIRV